MYIYQSEKEVNEQFGRKMNQHVNRNRKLFWKKVSKVNEGKAESCSRVKDGKGGCNSERLTYEGFLKILLKSL